MGGIEWYSFLRTLGLHKMMGFSGLVAELQVSPEGLCYLQLLKPLAPPAKHTASVLQKLAVL
jgi:hypothetical protein